MATPPQRDRRAPNLFAFAAKPRRRHAAGSQGGCREGALLVDAYGDAHPRPKKLKATKIEGAIRRHGLLKRGLSLRRAREALCC